MKTASWGLALSGGGAGGIANAGIIRALEEHNLRPNCISGSSMGAIIGGIYAAGHSMESCLELASKLRMINVAAFAKKPLREGLHSGIFRQRIEELLLPIVGDIQIGDCEIPFTCIAGKVRQPIQWQRIVREGFTEHVLESVEPFVFPDETRLIDALLASSAIPVIFAPVEIDGSLFIDLCHFGSIPARTLREQRHPTYVIGTDTNPEYTFAGYLPDSWKFFLETGYAELQKSKAACDILIIPKLPAQPFRFDRAIDFVEAGKTAAEKQIPAIQTLLASQK